VDEVGELRNLFSQWKQVLNGDPRINAGLITYHENSGIFKEPQQLLVEMKMAEDAGSNGIMLFDLDHMDEEQFLEVSKFVKEGIEN
jgi:tryptophan synthase alpha subunit